MSQASISQFNIQIGNALTQNVLPIMHEIRHSLEQLLTNGKSNIIDLRSIPLAPGEEDTIIKMLGEGELNATLDALGTSKIYETGYAGVWVISHCNETDNLIGRFIEITELPDILRSQQEDMARSLNQLTEILAETGT